MPAYSIRGTNVYLVGSNGVKEIVNGRSKHSCPSKETPVVVSASTELRRREIADLLSNLVKHIREGHKNARAPRPKRARREKIYMDLS